MKKAFTKMDALRECHNLWRWLSKPENIKQGPVRRNKLRWPGWRRFREVYDLVERTWVDTLCPACAYSWKESASKRNTLCNEACIIPVFAKIGSCLMGPSPYAKYEKALLSGNIEEACIYAKMISDSAKGAMKREDQR